MCLLTTLLITVACAFPTTTTTRSFLGGSDSSRHDRLRALSAEWNENDGKSSGALGKKSYNDGALYSFHMLTQAQKNRDYSAMDTYVDTNSLWNLAWHDSFVRNGLSDFVPPLTDTLNVLVVEGSGGASDGIAVVEEDVNDPTIVTTQTKSPTEGAASLNPLQKVDDSSCSFLAAVFDRDENDKENNEPGEDRRGSLDVASYDCIMDRGLMADLCASGNDRENLGRLLWEATKRIRENGIYVANTPPLSSEMKEYLTVLGKWLGLQWEFDLDGISDTDISVNVARKYWDGELPSFGKLAKVKY